MKGQLLPVVDLSGFTNPLTLTVSSDLVVHATFEDAYTDTDSDGLTDPLERQLGSDPTNPDSDSDGLLDGAEVNVYSTSPLSSEW